jgi:hypothetical protein
MPDLTSTDPASLPPLARSTRASFGLRVATMADGGEFRIPVHFLCGAEPGPRMVIMSTAHGYEIDQIGVLMELYRTTDLNQLRGELVLVPVANPAAFEMGSRNTWIDGLWGDSGNMNRLWPGRPNGWLTERFCHAIATMIGTNTDAVVDMHAGGPTRAIAYGYVSRSKPGEIGYELSLAFGHTILIRQTDRELSEKRQGAGTSSAWLREIGVASYSCEIGSFYGLFDERDARTSDPIIGVPEIGVRGARNLMMMLGMLPGTPTVPARRVIVQPELNLRPSHGGLLVSELDETAVGQLVPEGTILGTVISPYTFDVVDTLRAPFEQTLILAATYRKPYSKVNPGEIGYIVADWALTEETSWTPTAVPTVSANAAGDADG